VPADGHELSYDVIALGETICYGNAERHGRFSENARLNCTLA